MNQKEYIKILEDRCDVFRKIINAGHVNDRAEHITILKGVYNLTPNDVRYLNYQSGIHIYDESCEANDEDITIDPHFKWVQKRIDDLLRIANKDLSNNGFVPKNTIEELGMLINYQKEGVLKRYE